MRLHHRFVGAALSIFSILGLLQGVSCETVAVLYSGIGFTGSSQIVTAADVANSSVTLGSAWQHLATPCAANTPFAGATLRSLNFTVSSVQILNPAYKVALYGWYSNQGDSACGPSWTSPDANGNYNSWTISNASPAGVVVISRPVAILYSGVGFTGGSQWVTAADVATSPVALGSAWQHLSTACATSTPFAGATLRSLRFTVSSVQILNPAYKVALYGWYGNKDDSACGPSWTSPDANGNYNSWTISNASPAGVLVVLRPSCGGGSYWDSATSSCLNCPPGTSSQPGSTGLSSCTACSAGSFSPVSGSPSCSLCPAGQYQSRAGATSCVVCDAGTFSATTGAALCTLCSAGTYTAVNSSTSCTACPKGQYASSQGSVLCTPCPTNQYAPTTGQAQCTNCQPGTSSGIGAWTCCSKGPSTCMKSAGAALSDLFGLIQNGVCMAALGTALDALGPGVSLVCGPGIGGAILKAVQTGYDTYTFVNNMAQTCEPCQS